MTNSKQEVTFCSRQEGRCIIWKMNACRVVVYKLRIEICIGSETEHCDIFAVTSCTHFDLRYCRVSVW